MSAINGINGHGTNASEMHWKVGLLNSAQKYLTAESFGFKINASGTGLKKKQTWTLEQDATEDVVYIQSHLGRYMSTDKYGKVTCECQEPGETEKFVVEYASDGSGKWLFRNVAHGNYLGGCDDKIKGQLKNPCATEQWTPQLSIHPQVNLRNLNRRRYARLNDDQIQFTELTPWGQNALIILDFIDGKYALKTCDNRYLNRDGNLVDETSNETMFTLELVKSGQYFGLAFKDDSGRYLTAVGHTATMKARNKNISKDELFTIEDSHPQIILIASNGKKASIKQGVDVSANLLPEEDETDKETFQMEYNKSSGFWAFRTVDNKYWSLEAHGIQAIKSEIGKSTLFDVEWKGNGSVSLKASNGKYLYNKPTGSLTAASDSVGEKEVFRLKVINRSVMILRGEHGFIGFKTANAAKPEYVCNKSNYDLVLTEVNEDGSYYLKGTNGKYWTVATDGSIFAESDSPTPLLIEIRGQSIITVKAPNGNYLKGEQNGLFRAVGKEINHASIWEF